MEPQGHHRPSPKSKSDKDTTESGNESPNVTIQFEDGALKENLGERNRDFPNSEVDRNQFFTTNNAIATVQAGYESLGQSHIPKEATNWGEQPRPQTSQDMGSYDDYMVDDNYPFQSSCRNQQSMSSVKEPVKGDVFPIKAEIKRKLETASNQIFFVKIPSGGVCPNNTSFSKANFNFSFFPNMKCINLWKLWKPCVDALKDTTSPDPNIEAACRRLVDVCSRKEKILAMLFWKCNNEIQFNFFVATQIIQPLSGGICMVNRMPHGSSAGTKVRTPKEIGVRGLGIGYQGGWYGEADMVVCPPDEVDLQGLGTSTPHRPNSPGKCVVEGKHATLPGECKLKSFSQSVATLAIFSDIQRRRHPEKHTTFPMLWVGRDGVVVLIYDRGNDILMISNVISWDGCEAFVAMWAALSYNLFPALDLSPFKQYKCGLKAKLDEIGSEVEQYWYLVSLADFKDSKDNSSSILPKYKAL